LMLAGLTIFVTAAGPPAAGGGTPAVPGPPHLPDGRCGQPPGTPACGRRVNSPRVAG
jgi:hypothetical protein